MYWFSSPSGSLQICKSFEQHYNIILIIILSVSGTGFWEEIAKCPLTLFVLAFVRRFTRFTTYLNPLRVTKARTTTPFGHTSLAYSARLSIMLKAATLRNDTGLHGEQTLSPFIFEMGSHAKIRYHGLVRWLEQRRSGAQWPSIFLQTVRVFRGSSGI